MGEAQLTISSEELDSRIQGMADELSAGMCYPSDPWAFMIGEGGVSKLVAMGSQHGIIIEEQEPFVVGGIIQRTLEAARDKIELRRGEL